MKDVNIEYGNECFSGLAVTRHSKESFVAQFKSRMFIGISDEETEAILSDVWDNADKAVKEANQPPKKAIPVIEPAIEQETLNDNTEDKQRGVEGTSAQKKPAKNKKG